MVDSENSTSLSGVTRRALMAGTAAAPLAPILCHLLPDRATPDPIIALNQEWQRADAEAMYWCRRWGELEAGLARAMGYPRVSIAAPGSDAVVWATTHADIDRQLADTQDRGTLAESLHAKLAELTIRWKKEAETIGLNEAERQEKLAWDRRDALSVRMFSLHGRDLDSVVTKLTLTLRMGETRESDEEFPWPQIGAIIADLRRIVETGTVT
jgi:hypothetical protein